MVSAQRDVDTTASVLVEDLRCPCFADDVLAAVRSLDGVRAAKLDYQRGELEVDYDAGVMAFIFADLIVLTIIAAYRKYYGTKYALRITALMFVTMVLAALAVDLLFGGLGLIPSTRPSQNDIFGSIQIDYKLFLNLLGVVIFAALFALTMRRGATDPVCGMTVERAKALTAEHARRTFYFCSEHCRQTFLADPVSFMNNGAQPVDVSLAEHAHHG